jgi:hypothetical protein
VKTTLPRNPQTTEIQQHLRGYDLDGCLGVSLTLKQFAEGVKLDEIRASKNLRHFLNLLNSEVYGKRFKRFGKRLNVIPALERSSSGRLHYHLVLQKPQSRHVEIAQEADKAFLSLVENCWKRTPFGYEQIHIHDRIDHGWTDYISKNANTGDGIDWLNRTWN